MRKFLANAAKAASLLILLPAIALLAYDVLVVRPRLPEINALLRQADPQDASPPKAIRDLIDANVGLLNQHAVRLVLFHSYPSTSQGQSHMRSVLWGILLPIHLGETKMYGLYASLSSNGAGTGLSDFASRKYGLKLDQLSPIQAATVVAVTHAPTVYSRDSQRLDERARLLLDRVQHVP